MRPLLQLGTKPFFERCQMWLPLEKNICIVMTANSTDKTWHHMDVATLPAKQVFSSFSKTLNIRYTLMDCYSVDWCTLDLQKKLICNRGDTYWSITAGSRQGSLAKPLSQLFLTPMPALSSHQHRTLVCLFWSGNPNFAHWLANPIPEKNLKTYY